jgi:Cupredoxin-like domain
MSKKPLIITAIVLFVGLAVGLYIVLRNGPQVSSTPGVPSVSGQQGAPQPAGASSPVVSKTLSQVSSTVAVPDASSKNGPSNVAVPGVVVPAGRNTVSNERVFSVKVQNGAFVPDTVIVNQYDTVRISFQALDRDYDFVQPDMGLSSKLPMGVERIIEFSGVTAGKFTFYCSSCGGPGKGPLGYIIVVPKK